MTLVSIELLKAHGSNISQYMLCIAVSGGADILGSHEARAVVYDLTGLPQECGHFDGFPVEVDCQVEHSSSTSTAPCIAIEVRNLESPENGDHWVLRGPGPQERTSRGPQKHRGQ